MPGDKHFLGQVPNHAQPLFCAVNVVALTIHDATLKVLVTRHVTGGRQAQALPGVFVGLDETLETAAQQALRQETGWKGAVPGLIHVRTYSAIDRDPRARVITHSFVTAQPNLARKRHQGSPGTEWRPASDTVCRQELVLDHAQIVADAIEYVRGQIEHTDLAVAFCQKEFTISQLRAVYETVWGCELDVANFHRKMKPHLTPANGWYLEGKGRPAALFSWNGPAILNPAIQRPERL